MFYFESFHWCRQTICLTEDCCTRGSCLKYPKLKSHSLPTHETSLISMATLSLSQLYYKRRRRSLSRTGAVFFTPLGHREQEEPKNLNCFCSAFGKQFTWNNTNSSLTRQNTSVLPSHFLVSSLPASYRTKGGLEKRVEGVQVPLVVTLSPSWSALDPTVMLSQKQLQACATCYSHTHFLSRNNTETDWYVLCNIVTSCHHAMCITDIMNECNRSEDKCFLLFRWGI